MINNLKDKDTRDAYIYGLLSGLRAGNNTLEFAYSEVLRILTFQEGYTTGRLDQNKNRPEPYPPYELGTPEANAWLGGYRWGRNPEVEAQHE